jgi:hypothetical protein
LGPRVRRRKIVGRARRRWKMMAEGGDGGVAQKGRAKKSGEVAKKKAKKK